MDADSYKKLYPELYLDTFVNAGVRPDGRTLGKGRAVTIGPGAVNASQGSALVRLGHTSVLAGARASLMRPAEGSADEVGKCAVLNAPVDLPSLACSCPSSPLSLPPLTLI